MGELTPVRYHHSCPMSVPFPMSADSVKERGNALRGKEWDDSHPK